MEKRDRCVPSIFPEVKATQTVVSVEAEQLLGLFCLDLDMFSYRIKESQITFYRVKVSRRTNGKKDLVKHYWTKLLSDLVP